MTSVQIVELDRLDLYLDALAEILQACVHDGASVNFILPFEIEDARNFWTEKVAGPLAAGKRILLIGLLDGRVAGTVQLDLATPPNQAHRADVTKLLVHPNHRRSGVARALMQQIEILATEEGRWLLTLDTASAGAEALYESLGYERIGQIPAYARAPTEDRFEPATFMFKLLQQTERARMP